MSYFTCVGLVPLVFIINAALLTCKSFSTKSLADLEGWKQRMKSITSSYVGTQLSLSSPDVMECSIVLLGYGGCAQRTPK